MNFLLIITLLLKCLKIYAADSPFLYFFSLDMNYGKVTLAFNENVNASSFEVQYFGLQSKNKLKSINSTFYFTSTYNSMSLQGNTTNLYFFLSSNDYARLKIQSSVATSINNTFAVFSKYLVRSPNGTLVHEVNSSNAFQASEFRPDRSPPFVEGFDLNMNSGVIIIDFSEPILTSTFTLTGLALQSSSNVFPRSPLDYNPGFFAPPEWPGEGDMYGHQGDFIKLMMDESAAYITASSCDRRIHFQLGLRNINNIKKTLKLCTTADLCFLSGWRPFANDTSGNAVSLSGFEIINALQVKNFTADTMPPILIGWSLDLNDGRITLTFDEVVIANLFNYSCIVLTGTGTWNETRKQGNDTVIFRVRNPTDTATINSPNISFVLSREQFNSLKDTNNIAKTTNSTYIILEPGACVDASFSRNAYLGQPDASYSSPMRVLSLTQDVIRPFLVSATLDMTTQLLSLQFSEIVNIGTFNLHKLTLQSKAIIDPSTESLTLSFETSTLLNTANNVSLNIAFTSLGFAKLKLMLRLARSREHSYLSFSDELVRDLGHWPTGNAVIPISAGDAFHITVYVPDRSAPRLLNWEMDAAYDRITLYFSEPLNLSTLHLPSLSLQSDVRLSSPVSVKVSLSSSSYPYSVKTSVVFLQLSTQDVDRIKGTASLCLSFSSCYLTLSSGLARDIITYANNGSVVDNGVVEIPTPILSQSFIVDNRPPHLISYTLDMNQARLSLLFSEPVVGRNLNHSSVVLHSDQSGSTMTFSPSYCSFVLESISSTLTIGFCRADFHVLEETGQLATSKASTFLELRNGSVVDVSGNPSVGIGTKEDGTFVGLKSPSTYVVDANAPVLEAFSINRTSANLTVCFSVVLRVGYTAPSKISFILSGRSITLYKARVLNNKKKSDCVLFSLAKMYDDMLSIGIGASQDSTYMYLDAKAVFSSSTAATPSDRTSVLAPLREGQKVVSFMLDMNAKKLMLELAIPQRTFVLKSSVLRLQTADVSSYHTLTGHEDASLTMNGHLLEITLLESDFVAIQEAVYLTTDYRNLYLAMAVGSLLDDAGMEMTSSLVVPCEHIFPDTVRPSLLYFSIDFGLGILALTFSEPVLLSSIDLKRFSIVSNAVNASFVVHLNNSIVTNTGLVGTVVNVLLTNGDYPTDCDLIYLTHTIGYSRYSTYLTASLGAVADTGTPPNLMLGISSVNATRAINIVYDQSTPQMTSYAVDMFARTITLYFDKAVNFSSNLPSYYTLWSSSGKSTAPSVNLVTSTTVLGAGTQAAGKKLTIHLSSSDFDSIMNLAPALCTSALNTYIAFRKGAIRDISPSANPVAEVLYLYAVQVKTFIPDTSAPSLLSYDFSMQNGYVKLFFDKIINCAATQPSYMHFQYAKFAGISPYQFTLSSSSMPSCAQGYAKFVIISFGELDLNHLKSTDVLVKSPATTYLRLQSAAVTDVFGNTVMTMIDGRAKEAQNYYRDTMSPILLGFTALKGSLLRLIFNEPVMESSFSAAGLFVQDSSASFVFSYQLVSASVYSTENLRTVVYIDLKDDYYTIASRSQVFSVQLSSYLRATSSMLTDMSGNYLEEIPSSNALIMGPIIVKWTIDMKTGKVELYVSEPVSSAFSLAGIIVQNSIYLNSTQVTLTSTTARVQTNESSLSYYFSYLAKRDLNLLKYHRVASSLSTSWLVAPYGLTKSVSLETTIPTLATAQTRTPIGANSYIADNVPPLLLFVRLNLETGEVRLIFDEPVAANSLLAGAVTVLSKDVGSSATISSLVEVRLLNLTELTINLTMSDLNAIKSAHRTYPLDSAIVAAGCVSDFAGNSYAGNDADHMVSIDLIVSDTSAPKLLSFVLDLSRKIILLTFDEVIDTNTLRPTNVLLLSSSNASSSTSMRLSNYSVVYPSTTNLVSIDFGLYVFDALQLEMIPHLCTNASDSFIELFGVHDFFGNALDTTVYPSSQVIADEISPVLQSFDFTPLSAKTSSVIITLYFSKAISIATFQCSDFSFGTAATLIASTESVVLQKGECVASTVTDSRVVSFTIPSALSHTSLLGASQFSTYIFVSSGTNITDLKGNLLATGASVALEVGPHLIAYTLDMNAGHLVMVFSKPVNRSAPFNSSCVGFVSETTGLSMSLDSTIPRLGHYLVDSPTLDSIAVVQLSSKDLLQLKSLNSGVPKTFIILHSNALTDSLGLFVVPVGISEKFSSGFTAPDTQPPNIVSFELDMGLETITIVFDEPIQSVSVNPSNFRLQSKPHNEDTSRKLYSGGTVVVRKETMILYMALVDAAAIKLIPALCKSKNDSYLSFTLDTVTDVSGVELRIDSASNARQADVYVNDTIPPVLVTFGIDMNSGILQLNFSEPVLATDFNISAVTLQSRYLSTQGYKYELTGGTVLSGSNWHLSILLSPTDLRGIKMTPKLCRSQQLSYITVKPHMTKDTSGNQLSPINDGAALQCSDFNADSTPPTVTSITINMNTGALVFQFSDLVDVGTVVVTTVVLQSAQDILSGESYELSLDSLVVTSSTFSSVVEIQLSTDDLNIVKFRFPLFSSLEYSWISFSASFCDDTFGNAVIAVPASAATQVSTYIPDTILPQLVSYALNMNLNYMILGFDKSMSIGTVNTTQLTMLEAPVKRFGYYLTLSNTTAVEGADASSALVTVQFDMFTLTLMKWYGLGLNETTSYLSWGTKFIADNGGNYLLPRWDASVYGKYDNNW